MFSHNNQLTGCLLECCYHSLHMAFGLWMVLRPCQDVEDLWCWGWHHRWMQRQKQQVHMMMQRRQGYTRRSRTSWSMKWLVDIDLYDVIDYVVMCWWKLWYDMIWYDCDDWWLMAVDGCILQLQRTTSASCIRSLKYKLMNNITAVSCKVQVNYLSMYSARMLECWSVNEGQS